MRRWDGTQSQLKQEGLPDTSGRLKGRISAHVYKTRERGHCSLRQEWWWGGRLGKEGTSLHQAALPSHLEVRIWASELSQGTLASDELFATIIAPSPPCPFLHRLIHIPNSASRFTFQQEALAPTRSGWKPPYYIRLRSNGRGRQDHRRCPGICKVPLPQALHSPPGTHRPSLLPLLSSPF